MKRLFVLTLLAVFLTGCAKIAHMQELLRIKAMSDNQEGQHKYVEKTNENFDKLIEAVENNAMDEYTSKKSILRAFGEPIYSKEVVRNGQNVDRWLYRYAMKYFGSEKVYIYFDDSGKIIDIEHYVPPEKKEDEDE